MGLKRFILIGTLCLASCGAASPFGYRYYNLKPASYEGKLEGDKPENDLPLSECAPAGKEVNRCVVMLTREAYRLKAELLKAREDVKCWQSGRCHN